MENAAFGSLCRVGRAVPRLIPALNRLSSAALSARTYDASYRVFVTPRRVRFTESEYAVPRESLAGVLAELRRAVPRLADPVMFPVEVRVAAADDIWLSTAHGRDTAYIAIHQYARLPYQAYFEVFESIVAEVGGRPHRASRTPWTPAGWVGSTRASRTSAGSGPRLIPRPGSATPTWPGCWANPYRLITGAPRAEPDGAARPVVLGSGRCPWPPGRLPPAR